MLKWLDATVTNRQVWAPGLFTLRIRAPEVQPFEPGQFLHLGKPDASGELVSRAYSVASPHGEELEFFIVKVDGGQLTPVLDQMQPGDAVQVKEKAAGGFTLEKTPAAKAIWLIGTGTGLAPYIAMLREKKIWERYGRIVVCHGVRVASDLGYRDELTALQAARPGQFTYVGATSRESPPGLLSGRLTTLLESGALEAHAGVPFDPACTAVMMCGNPDMLTDMETLLGARGLVRHRSKSPGHIVVENYW
jgi:ferredoxin/flavodoxin---NADP+ reductase